MPRSKAIVIAIISGLLISGILGIIISYIQSAKRSTPQSITISMVGYTYTENQVDPLIQSFEKSNPNVTVTYKQIDKSTYRQYVLDSMHSTNPVNIFEAESTDEDAFIKYTKVAPQNLFTADQFSQIYYPVFKRGLLYNNQYVMGIPEDFQPLILVYNKDIATNANIDMTKAVSSLASFNSTIQAFRLLTKDYAGINIGAPGNINEAGDILQLFMLQDGTPMNDNTKYYPDINNSNGIQALNYYTSFMSGDYIDSWNTNGSDDISQFANGKVLMILTYPENVSTILKLNPKLNLGFAVFPSLQAPVTLAHYDYLAVDSKGANSDESWNFLKYITDKDNFVTLTSAPRSLSPYTMVPPRDDIPSLIPQSDLETTIITASKIAKDWNFYDYSHTNGVFKALIIQYVTNNYDQSLLGLAQKDISTLIQKSFQL